MQRRPRRFQLRRLSAVPCLPCQPVCMTVSWAKRTIRQKTLQVCILFSNILFHFFFLSNKKYAPWLIPASGASAIRQFLLFASMYTKKPTEVQTHTYPEPPPAHIHHSFSKTMRRTSNRRPYPLPLQLTPPGTLAAHGKFCLVLLCSQPDTVRRHPLRKTQTSSPLIKGSNTGIKPSARHHPCYSGLQVQGTAAPPAAW